MKPTQLSALSLALTACLSSGMAYADDDQNQSKKLNYPHTPIHQDNLDPFLHGEFGMSSNTAGIKNAVHSSNPHAPDDGIDHYASGTQVDKYRWLEDYDNIDPRISKETSEDRERNFIGTRQEDDKPLAQETIKHLQTVPPKTSSKVNDWVNAQNAVTEDYIYQLPIYEQLKKNTDAIKNVESTISRVYRKDLGEIRTYRHADGFRRIELIGLDGRRTEIVNEANLSADGKKAPDGKAAMRGTKVSKDGTYVSFFVRQGSADSDPWFLHIVNTKTGKLATPIIGRISRTNPAMKWFDDNTIYYTAAEQYRSLVFYREIGKEKFNDPIAVPLSYVDGASINSIDFDGEDKRYIIMDTWDSADSVYIIDRKTNTSYRLHDKKFFDEVFKYDSSFNNNILAKLVHFDPETRDVWIISGENNRKGEIIKTNLDNLKRREVVLTTPDEFDIMREAYYHEEGDGYFLVSYLQHGVSRLLLVNMKTAETKELTPVQGAGYISKLSGNVVGQDEDDEEDKEAKKHDPEASENYVKFRFSNPTFPSTDYKYSISKDKFLDIRRYDLTPFDDSQFETKLVFYTANDGTKIPMNISYKKGIKLDGNNPTLLYGYGGYGVIYDQQFGFPANPMWLENGGVWAHAFIRGGGEYGEAWQKAAEHDKRLVGYDDFASAADYLNSAGYANPDHLGIIGGSNGGLLVGAAMVRHPEKYRVAFPQVAVFDQFRHEKAGITQYWMKEYGTPEEGRHVYNVLMSYSPYQKLTAGTCYPSTLIQTSKRDDRVVPSHSYRFTAKLQEVQSCDRPTLLHAAEDQGHSPNTYAERIEDELMTITFAFNEMGVTTVPNLEVRPSADDLKTEKWRAEDAQKEQEYLKYKEQMK
ncbi:MULTISPECIES: prolyl oligopeptidase family serine peptidase [unclassified Moraxella]|uniref:prolyl oligopeptidase family serine peptidase n=1 Tax=unclassified Moraxella TaxID=2685852 RepID=UPI00359DCBDA